MRVCVCVHMHAACLHTAVCHRLGRGSGRGLGRDLSFKCWHLSALLRPSRVGSASQHRKRQRPEVTGDSTFGSWECVGAGAGTSRS